ncbi:MAG TPA: hypothetical protein VFQ60_05670 [Patescibacteria group bacterium]|nr:hypothetical protein [Patescibacteria group bacterium]
MPRFHQRENPFHEKNLDPNTDEFINTVLRRKSGTVIKKAQTHPAEDWGDVVEADDKAIEEERVFGELYARERSRLQKFFGMTIDVPHIPKGVTPEKIAQWESMGFKLEYWPKINMTEEKNFPGWLHKPGKRYTPEQRYGIEFFDEANTIQNLPENRNNPKLQGLKMTELPGCWILADMRDKPVFEDDENQAYTNDTLIQGVLKHLVSTGIVNHEASTGLRNKIHPRVFDNPAFWEALKMALQVHDIPGVVLRLPRIIESNVRGQSHGFHNTNTYEWCEEYYESGRRIFSGGSDHGGASYLNWRTSWLCTIGFRPLVVFPQN